MDASGWHKRVADGLWGFRKAPGDVVDIALTWSDHLGDGETVSSGTWVVPAGLTAGSESVASPLTIVRVSGGSAGQEYKVTCQMVKSDGERRDRTIVVEVVAELS